MRMSPFGTEQTNRHVCSLSASLSAVWVKHFQTNHHSSVDVAHGLALLFGLGTKALPSWGFEDEVEQSIGRPCRHRDGGFKRSNELTSSIVPRIEKFIEQAAQDVPGEAKQRMKKRMHEGLLGEVIDDN